MKDCNQPSTAKNKINPIKKANRPFSAPSLKVNGNIKAGGSNPAIKIIVKIVRRPEI